MSTAIPSRDAPLMSSSPGCCQPAPRTLRRRWREAKISRLISKGRPNNGEPRMGDDAGANRDVGVEKEPPRVGLVPQFQNTHEHPKFWRQHDIGARRSGKSPVVIDERIAEN